MRSLSKRAIAEALGTAFLLIAVVGSGIMAERLAGGNIAIALLANTLATGGALVCIIASLGPISGAHLNPAVSVADAFGGGLPWRDVPVYCAAQIAGAIIGVASANLMFGLPIFFASQHVRNGPAILFAEFIATFGLMIVIWGSSRFAQRLVPFTVAAYIIGAYWFTSSTSFANPAVTIARSLSDTFAGIRPIDVPGFMVVQFVAAIIATGVFTWLSRT